MHECGASAPRWWRGRGDAGPRRDADAWNPGSRGCTGGSRATMTEAERDSDLVESGLKGHGIERRRRDQGQLDRESRSFWRLCGGRHALRRNAAKCSCERPLSAQMTTCSEPCSQRIASGGHTPAAWGGAEHARAGEWIGFAWTSGCRSVAPSISLSLPSITSIRSNRFGPREPRGVPAGACRVPPPSRRGHAARSITCRPVPEAMQATGAETDSDRAAIRLRVKAGAGGT